MRAFKVSKPLLLVDFDRTLFDTSLFVDWLWRKIEEEYGIDGQKEKERARQFYSYSGDWYDYLFFDHLRAIPELSSDDLAGFTERMYSLSGRPSFLYPDSKAVIDEYDEIVTFGNEPYQRFKLGFCPELASVPTRIIQTAKAEYIAANYHKPVILVDDKHLEDDLPDWVTFVLIDREQNELTHQRRDNFWSVNSLRGLKQISEIVAR